MAETPLYKWRTPEGVAKPIVHVDMQNLANDIEATVRKAPQLLPGYPKVASLATGASPISGWVGSRLSVLKYKIADNLFKYEFNGYIERSTSITINGGAALTNVANFLSDDINITGLGVNVMFPCVLHGAGVINDSQLLFAGRDLQIRNRSTVTYVAGIAVSVAVTLYGTS